MDDATVTAEKAALRRRMLSWREGLDPGEREAAGRAIAMRMQPLLAQPAPPPIVSGFLPIGAELDPRPAMQAASTLGCRLCLPVMIGRGLPLQFKAWAPGDPLVTRQWGIREPAPAAETLAPMVVLVPLLAFDVQGGRLGYGGGYYDRTLRTLRANGTILAIGLAFDQQGVDAVPRLDYDEPLDRVVTPTRVITCRQAA